MKVGLFIAIAVIALLLLAVVGLGVIGGIGYFVFSSTPAPQPGSSPASPIATPSLPSPSSSSTSSAERPSPTPAQTAAIANGQQAAWSQQDMSWTVPGSWNKTADEKLMFTWRSPGGFDAANLIVNASDMPSGFPVDVSLKSYYDQYTQKKASGEVDELRWLELDGVKGIQWRETPPKDSDIKRLQWIGYRTKGGTTQYLSIMLSVGEAKHFAKHQDAMYGVLYSTKIGK